MRHFVISYTVANYAYHQCDFKTAIDCAKDTDDPRGAILQIKSLCELDRPEDALLVCDNSARSCFDSGELYYWQGVCRYLAGYCKEDIEESFIASDANGFIGSGLGMAFLSFLEGDYIEAMNHVRQEIICDYELEHIRLMILCQTQISAQQLKLARKTLEMGQRVQSRLNSLLRNYWADICWIRLYRACGNFEIARFLIDRLDKVVDRNSAPRLWRNVAGAAELTNKGQRECEINLPTRNQLEQRALSGAICKKPMLNSLFHYLLTTRNNSGGVSKEDIVHGVWRENYNPLVHDGRIYKAIGRLRLLLGDDKKSPHILTQKGDFYVLCFAQANNN